MEDKNAQSLRSLTGKNLEEVVAYVLNRILNSKDIFAIKGNKKHLHDFFKDEEKVEDILNAIKIPIDRKLNQMQSEELPDADLLVFYWKENTFQLLAIISCKRSFHSRHVMVTFWSLVFKESHQNSQTKYVVVTEDNDQYHKDEKRRRTELGKSHEQSTATRRILEGFTDKVYIIKPYQSETKELEQDLKKYQEKGSKEVIFDLPNHPNHTEYCNAIRPFDDLIQDLLTWKKEFLE